MLKFLLRRTLIMIPQLFILSVLIFLLAKSMPGDALTGQIGPQIDAERLIELREKAGLNDPWHEQYARWIGNVIQGDFGKSAIYQQKVTNLIGDRLGNTLLLSASILLVSYLIAIPLGIIAGRWTDSWVDKLIVWYNYLAFATPLFVFALIILFIFGFTLQWFPIGGSVDIQADKGTMDYVLSKTEHLVLPTMAGSLLATFGTIQYLRNEIIDTKIKDFVKTARSKGVPERKVYSQHIFRNSLLPIAAFLGYEITGLIGGSIFLESIFSYPGLGQLFLSSISSRDFSVVNILVLISGSAAIVGTMLSDLILSWVDPRIRVD
ncbi:oligopeptide ABC transporter permease [Paenisporosarcina indica]|uniref:oligopeptide ABC transporter permease n=1 Tax=Paenisporosarcina indica TaxID=650093 RepID=UPI00094FC889|nr:oligopeptide ABC transporter permease [Paenisporosarcina indica]